MPSLQFKGKSFIQNYHLSVPFHELIPVKEKSLTGKPSLTDNLIIHGDNLKALKALLPLYANKVKCIYIDPPYNTGNEKWVYNDNVNSPMMQEWFGKVVDREDLTRHDKWLCMMTPRLKLLRELLREDGVVCLSIDDTELAKLVVLLDEIFGEENKEEIICWRRRHNQPNDKNKPIAKVAEFIVIYAKNLDFLKKSENFYGLELTGIFSNPDNDSRGDWASKPWKSGSGQSGSRYKIKGKSGKAFDEEWLGSPETFEQLLKDGRIYFGKDGGSLPRKKYFKSERAEEGQVPTNFWDHNEFGSNQEASDELAQMGITFDNPKPVRLLKALFRIFTREDDIILDSFSGSGTTAQATLALNTEDEGNRQFVLVECEDYAEKITAERVKRSINGVKSAKDDSLKTGLDGSFTFCKLGEPMDEQRLLTGKTLPTYEDLARYVFYVSTGEEFKPNALNKSTNFIGVSSKYHVYMFYEPDTDALRSIALDLDKAEKMKPLKDGKRRLVFAPTKYLDQDYLDKFQIDFAQLPYEIYQRAK